MRREVTRRSSHAVRLDVADRGAGQLGHAQQGADLEERFEVNSLLGQLDLAAAEVLAIQEAGMSAELDAKLYAGGMASTVELFDGYRFEIAGSVQFPTSQVVVDELGLDTLPTIDLDVMSVALRGVGDDPMIQYSDPIKLFTHLNEVHGADAVNGMAGLMAWSQAPTRALGRSSTTNLANSCRLVA